jgi:hypothetical protein
MNTDELESGKRDDLRHLNDDDLVLVTGGASQGGIFHNGQHVICTCGPASGYSLTPSECNYWDHLYGC